MAGRSQAEIIAQELSALGGRVATLEARMHEIDKVIARLEGAALTTAQALQEVSHHWDAVYEAMRREHNSHMDRPFSERESPNKVKR
jgi:uncharacterized coiled-coil protein SlyX